MQKRMHLSFFWHLNMTQIKSWYIQIQTITWLRHLWQHSNYSSNSWLWYHITALWIRERFRYKRDKKLHFCKQADVFSGTRLSKSDLTEAVEKALVSLYHGREEEGLDALHCRKFCERIKGAIHIEPQNLPPTFAASVYHSLRVFFQITQWKGEDVDMNP